jgi:hypothetical protein
MHEVEVVGLLTFCFPRGHRKMHGQSSKNIASRHEASVLCQLHSLLCHASKLYVFGIKTTAAQFCCDPLVFVFSFCGVKLPFVGPT